VVASLLQLGGALDRAREVLRRVSDLSRIASRLAGRRLRPPELSALRSSLEAVAELKAWLSAPNRPPRVVELSQRIDPLSDLAATLRAAIPEPPPVTVEAGGLFRPGFRPELDRYTRESASALAELEALERREVEASGIRSLRIGYNQVFGYYFEVTRPHLSRVPPHFRRKQTLSGAERFTSEELATIETRLLTAREQASEAELKLWETFLGELDSEVPRLHRLSRVVGEVDVLLSFARIAHARGYVRPIVDDGPALQLRDGRHPVLERMLGERFVPNDTDLDLTDSRLLVLTGPNMSGKSTYMRQVGLLVLLAQVGAFLPAKYARVGVVSALFTRMGFTDEIARGKSSFMVEMTEVAEILRSADERSLVLLDEVGRGTSTFDGLALAWATLKELHDRIRCRTILATHYHQLTELIETLPGARNAHLAVRDDSSGVVFLHRLVPGSTDRSYGLHVARLAGLPSGLLAEAEATLRRLEAGGIQLRGAKGGGRPSSVRYTQAVLLTATNEPKGAGEEIVRELAGVDPDRLAPFEALRLVTEWRRRLPPPEKGDP
jgi:DNA mismatch repair protein MutS